MQGLRAERRARVGMGKRESCRAAPRRVRVYVYLYASGEHSGTG